MIIYSLSPQPSITNCKAIEKRSTLKISSLTLKNKLFLKSLGLKHRV